MAGKSLTTIFLCRHSETEFSRDDRYYYDELSPFTEAGKLQTTDLAQRFSSEVIAAVFSSPFARAVSTATEIAKLHNLPIEIVPEFAEINPGIWSGLTRTEVRRRFPAEYESWISEPAVFGPPKGESCYEMAARSLPAFLTLCRRFEGESIVVMAHNTVNRVLLAHILDIPINQCRERITQPAGGVTRLDHIDGIWNVTFSKE